ncbi:uncharacterized protein LY89DRAFT_714745 [Mollisia scopiformis]|uniref:Uncharacterized protein n=1 Tax=Mollisia scopiformis TaxID=149040 RepID=A0A194XNC4_MOLSC|nr:uncharacterized protein LY89DRAFT_714745 [Mollisia scopiformis]KUJ21673.1 hypothetical protein LY89DRAFT_714745 [Mollisia scopiformis]
MPLMPLTLEQKDAIREYLHADPRGKPRGGMPLLVYFVITAKSPVRRLLNILVHPSDFYDPTGPQVPLRRQNRVQIYLSETCRIVGIPEALILMYDVADRESFVELEKSYDKICDVLELEKNYDKTDKPPARGLFKRVTDRLFKRPQWEAPVPYPIFVFAVILNRSASRQVTYDEGLELSDRLSAIFLETSRTGLNNNCFDDLASRSILARTKKEPNRVDS